MAVSYFWVSLQLFPDPFIVALGRKGRFYYQLWTVQRFFLLILISFLRWSERGILPKL